MSDNEVWPDILSDQIIRRERSCTCLVDCENDHDVRSYVYGLTMSDQLLNIIPVKGHSKSQVIDRPHILHSAQDYP